MLDRNLKPWLLEVNNNPSLRMDFEREVSPGVSVSEVSPVDEAVKRPVLAGALELAMRGGDPLHTYDQVLPQLKSTWALARDHAQAKSAALREARGDDMAAASAAASASDSGSVHSYGTRSLSSASMASSDADDEEAAFELRANAPFNYFDAFAGGDSGSGGGGGSSSTKYTGVSPEVDVERLSIYLRVQRVYQVLGRGESLSSSKFNRAVRRCGLLPSGASTADVDLLFMQVL